MKLAVSTMGFGPRVPGTPGFRAVATLLRSNGVAGVELAPTTIWPQWQGATAAAARALRGLLADEGLSCPAMQSIVYGVDGAGLFRGDAARQVLFDHLQRVADLANNVGATYLVLGAPSIRFRGDTPPEVAFDLAVEFFRSVAASFASRGVALCIEPNPPQYGCDFITTAQEGHALVRAVAHPEGFALHLDCGGMTLGGADAVQEISDLAGGFVHFHVSEPGLKAFDAGSLVPHVAVARALRDTSYRGWTSLEMREVSEDVLRAVIPAFAAAYAPASLTTTNEIGTSYDAC